MPRVRKVQPRLSARRFARAARTIGLRLTVARLVKSGRTKKRGPPPNCVGSDCARLSRCSRSARSDMSRSPGSSHVQHPQRATTSSNSWMRESSVSRQTGGPLADSIDPFIASAPTGASWMNFKPVLRSRCPARAVGRRARCATVMRLPMRSRFEPARNPSPARSIPALLPRDEILWWPLCLVRRAREANRVPKAGQFFLV